jgi:hypothetical protein
MNNEKTEYHFRRWFNKSFRGSPDDAYTHGQTFTAKDAGAGQSIARQHGSDVLFAWLEN